MTKKEERALAEASRLKKLDDAIDAADAAAKKLGVQRIGVVTPEEAHLVKLIVEDMFLAIPPAKRSYYIGSLNEVLCYVTATEKRS